MAAGDIAPIDYAIYYYTDPLQLFWGDASYAPFHRARKQENNTTSDLS